MNQLAQLTSENARLRAELKAAQSALAASNGLRVLVMQERDELSKERDEARAALRGAMQYVDWSGVPVCEMDECLERWREIAGTDTANNVVRGGEPSADRRTSPPTGSAIGGDAQ